MEILLWILCVLSAAIVAYRLGARTRKTEKQQGTMYLEEVEGKTAFTLELEGDPLELKNREQVIFSVVRR